MTKKEAPIPPFTDLFDFYECWPDLRPLIAQLIESERLDTCERLIISAMTELVDRVGPSDFSRDLSPWPAAGFMDTKIRS